MNGNNQPTWGCFLDPSYFDMWAVKQISNQRFDEAYHVTSEVEARRLCALLNTSADLNTTTAKAAPAVPEAMAVVVEALRSDPEYAWSWHCNVAMSAFDEGIDHYRANKAAARFLSLLAGVDTTKNHNFPADTSQEPIEMTLRDYADSLVKAGHDFWEACRRDAGGGAVRWLSCDDGTLIVFTRGEYRDAIMGAVGGYRATEVVFEDQANDEQGGVVACAVTSQPMTDEVFGPIVKAAFDAGWAACRASELVGDNAKEFAWDMSGDEITERLIAALREKEKAE